MAESKTRLLNVNNGSIVTLDATDLNFNIPRNYVENNVPSSFTVQESDDLGMGTPSFTMSAAFSMATGSATGDATNTTMRVLYPFYSSSGLKMLVDDLVLEVFGGDFYNASTNANGIMTTGSDSTGAFYSGCKVVLTGWNFGRRGDNDIVRWNMNGLIQKASVT